MVIKITAFSNNNMITNKYKWSRKLENVQKKIF